MTQVSDAREIQRFMDSPEGLEEFRKVKEMVLGRKIVDVTFENHTFSLGTLFHFDDGSSFIIFQPSFLLEELQNYFPEVLEREEVVHGRCS